MAQHSDNIIGRLRRQNEEWAAKVEDEHPDFFPTTAGKQEPKVYSRVPESVILGCMPGEIFSHRNIANQVFPDDPNLLSVITYALLDLRVQHIIVAGHSHCGGVAVCIDKYLTARDKAECFDATQKTDWPPPAPIDGWLQPLRDMAESYENPPKVQELVEANVREQVRKVVDLAVVQQSWASLQGPQAEELDKRPRLVAVHGWWYAVESGLVHQEVTFKADGLVEV